MILEPIHLFISFGICMLVIYILSRQNKKRERAIFWPHCSESFGKKGKFCGSKFKFWLPLLFYALSLVLLIITLGRPRSAEAERLSSGSPTLSLLVLDRSGSMKEQVYFMDEQMDRLQAARKTLKRFVEHAGHGDLGLITFAAFAQLNSPLSSDYTHLKTVLDSVQTATAEEQGTAIGDAIFYASLILQQHFEALQTLLHTDLEDEITKNIILLTDGEQNFGKYEPLEAAYFAAEHNINIYTVLFNEKINAVRLFPSQMQNDHSFSQLMQVADLTGGELFHATTGEELESIYMSLSHNHNAPDNKLKHTEYYVYFLFAALAFFVIAETCNHFWKKEVYSIL